MNDLLIERKIRKIKRVSVAVMVATVVGGVVFLAAYYFSPEERAERMFEGVNASFMDAHRKACEFGLYADKHELEDNDYMISHCEYLPETDPVILSEAERILAWGKNIHNQFSK